jgi:two-component system, chemotaxis family, protein-glutamate methylesterase/glutaminase
MNHPGTEHQPNAAVVLAVRGSTGSVQPLIEIVRDLLDDLPTSVLLTIHVGEQTRLPQILPRSGPLRATLAENREVLEPGRIYIAPRGRHLIARNGRVLLSSGPRVNRHWPAVDVMFASTGCGAWSARCSVTPACAGDPQFPARCEVPA